MKILKYKNIEVLKILSFSFIFFYFLLASNFVSSKINPYNTPAACSKDSQCVSSHGDGTCCMADIYSNDSLYKYFTCISTSSNPSTCAMYSGTVTNKCWPSDVCTNGLDYAISGIVPINGACGSAIGLASIAESSLDKLKSENQFCSSGTISTTYPKLNKATKTWTWTCSGQNNGTSASCTAKYSDAVSQQINGVCYTYSSSLSSEPTQLCVAGSSGPVVLNDGVFSWVCSGKNGGASISCNANAKAVAVAVVPETNPFTDLANDPLTKPTTKNNATQTEIVSGYPTIEQKSANVSSYSLLEKYVSPCSIKFDSECEVLDQKLLDVIKAKSSIQDAINAGKLNGDLKVARLNYLVTPPKELDNYKTGLTLTNIQKLRKARVFPVGLELAALCITGQIPCSDGYIYDLVYSNNVYVDANKNVCTLISATNSYKCGSDVNEHKLRSAMGDITLNNILAGYSVCDPLASGYSPKNNRFCHLVNPNWILKDPKYMCESGTKNGPLLYVTDKQSQSNIRYETCPDVSTCLTEKDNEDCNAYGYCLREKNIWRFDLSADSCFNQNVGCSKYTYTMGGKTTVLGLIADTTDKSVCDTSNAGCRKYSLVKTGSDSTDWSYSSSDKIFLNSKVSVCDSTSEGCTAFIRRDSANLIKNSSFEEYKLSSDFSVKQASFWLPYIGGVKVCSNNANKTCVVDSDCDSGYSCNYGGDGNNVVQLETSSDNVPVYNGSNSLVIQRTSSADASSYAGYSLNSDYFVDVEPNKTYTLSYYVLGYNISFTSNDISKHSKGAFVNVKEYDQNKKIIAKKICTSGDDLYLGSICNIASDCGNNGVCSLSSTSNNIIDVESFRYVSNFLSSTWTRKTVSFKTGLNTYYLDIIPVLSRLRTEEDKKPATVVFDAIQLQEGGNATTYSLYEDSKINYLKKAPDYANCYSSSSDKDKIFCSNFIKSCDKKDVGCRKYQKKDDDEYWLPGKPNEDNYCTAACKGYQLYKEAGPSYNPINGSSFQSFIDTTAQSCSSGDAGCSQYTNLSTKATEYYSSIRTCVRQTDDIGVCEAEGSYKGAVCSSDADCGAIVGSCKKSTAQYADYFTYTGSETSGYKLNVYRLLRTKACSNNINLHCSNDSDCGGSATCGYYNNVYNPAVTVSDSFSVCNEDAYKQADHDPDCREFHGPKDSTSASGGSNGDYVLYYANMSDVIFVSDDNCSYYSIVPYQSTMTKTECDKVSYISPSLRYVTSTSTCNIGIYIPESTTCGSAALNCREYNGTSISSETLFSDSFENGDDSWRNKNGSALTSPSISTESIFVNEHSLKIAYPESIIKIVAPEIINPEEKALYKLRLYAKNDSADGTLSTIRLKVGSAFSSSKQISNDWRFVGFDIFASTNLNSADISNYIEIINDGLVTANKSVNLFVDYISIEKSSSVYVIKDSWNTPVSCDNSIDNPTGACNTIYQQLGFCTMQPSKVCLTGDKVGSNCNTASNCSADGLDKGDKCDYPNKICRWGDNKNSSCNSDDDCYNDPNSSINANAKVDSCSYTTTGYRLELGKMIGCDEYIDSYNNDEFYVFNDLNLCSADKMGCEALYDTKNSKSYQRQEFNSDVDYSGIVAYYTFDDKTYLAKNDYSSTNIRNNNSVVYTKDGASSGAALFNGTNNMTEAIGESLKKATTNLSLYSWVRPNSFGGTIVSLGGYYNLSISNSGENKGQVICSMTGLSNGVPTTKTINSKDYKLSLNKWQNVLCTYDGDRLKIYVNGEFANSSDDVNITLTYGSDSSSLLKIGDGVVGSIDDLRIYNKFFDSKMAYNAYTDYSDNYYVDADELGYYIIDSKYSCDSKYKGCIAVGRNEDRYDSADFGYSTAFLVVDPDKFKSSGNYSTTGVYDATMCKAEEEGCYSFKDANSAIINFKFPKTLCVYKTNVDVGLSDLNTGNAELKTGWFKYDNKAKVISDEGCYLADVKKTGVANPKADSNSYRIVSSSDCEYKKDPVVVRRTFHGSCSYNPLKTCSVPDDCAGEGTCDLHKYVTRPKQTTYYIYTGKCSDDSGLSCYEDSVCSSGYCLLERTNTKCDSNTNNPYCKPYGYDENSGVIDQFSNKSFEFDVCQSGTKIGSYCSNSGDCLGAPCGAPWTVVGWFKKNSTKGCSDDGLECVGGTDDGKNCAVDSDCNSGKCQSVIEKTDYMRDYNDSVGVCNEYGCTNFIEPTENRCTAGNLDGYECSSDGDCGASGVCKIDELNGSKYCKAKVCTSDSECASGAKCDNVKGVCATVNKLNQSCVFDKDCGFGGICTGNNIYSYINNDKINSTGCNGKVSRESGCVLFNDTSNSQLKFSSKLTYSGVKNGIAVAAVTGDNSGGDSQKDSNLIIKVSRDRECSEWLTFDGNGSPTKQDYDVATENAGKIFMYTTCKKLSEDNRCMDGNGGSGWSNSLDVKFYMSQMNGNWFNEDFSGFSIPNRFSVNNNSYWWKTDAYGSNAILSNNKASTNVICKSYPETTSPFNFIDRFQYELCGSDAIGTNSTGSGIKDIKCAKDKAGKYFSLEGTTLTYDQFKALTPKDYFKNVYGGISVPYALTSGGDVYYRIDNKQDCYYQKVNYKDLSNPREQYFGKGQGDLPANVCYSSSDSNYINGTSCKPSAFAPLESKIADYTTDNLKYKGYCAEYDYSHEIYYTGSGKYNCLTWIPGFINEGQ